MIVREDYIIVREDYVIVREDYVLVREDYDVVREDYDVVIWSHVWRNAGRGSGARSPPGKHGCLGGR